MTALKITSYLLLVLLLSCNSKQSISQPKHKVDPLAEALYQQTIPLINYTEDADSCRKALLLFDSATSIDDSCAYCYSSKLSFLNTLSQPDKIALVYTNLIRLHPKNGRLYLSRGNLYEHSGDTLSARKDFQTSLKLYNEVLDTMSSKSRNYSATLFDKALRLIMLDQQAEGNHLLKQLCKEEKEETIREYVCSYINKTKKELLEFEPPDHSSASISQRN